MIRLITLLGTVAALRNRTVLNHTHPLNITQPTNATHVSNVTVSDVALLEEPLYNLTLLEN